MPIATVTERAPQGAPPPAAILPARLISVVSKIRTKKDSTETYERWVWKFTIEEEGAEYDGRNVYGETWPDLEVGSQALTWVEEMLGGSKLSKDFNFNTDNIEGVLAKVRIIHEPYKKDGESRVAVKVAEVIRASLGAPVQGGTIIAQAGGVIAVDDSAPF